MVGLFSGVSRKLCLCKRSGERVRLRVCSLAGTREHSHWPGTRVPGLERPRPALHHHPPTQGSSWGYFKSQF